MKNLLLAGAATLALTATAAQAATTIDTVPSWDGSSAISPFGGGGTGIYGETFTAPGTAINSFTFYVNDFGNALTVSGGVYAWAGSLTGGAGSQGATGAALFSGPTFVIAGVQGFQAVTVNTGSTPLTAGSNYVAFLEDTGTVDQSSSSWGDILFSHPGVPGDGGFNFWNNHGNPSGTWDDFADFGSLAWSASFNSVPEPGTWSVMLLGLGGLGALARRRRSVAAAA